MSPSRKIKRELKKTGLIQFIMKCLEEKEISRIGNGYPKELGISLYEYFSQIESQTKQITGAITIQVCSLFTFTLLLQGNEFLKKNGSSLRIKNKNSILTKTEEGIEFDVCFEMDGVEVLFEIKMSQNINKFQGSTHGKNKVDDFIMIQFRLNQNVKIKDSNLGILGDVWIGMTKEKPTFIGKATDNNSRTYFSYTKNEYTVEDIQDCTIFGSSKLIKTNYKLIGAKLYE